MLDREWEIIKARALEYAFEDVSIFLKEYPLEAWMDNITEDPDAEMFSSRDLLEINDVLLRAFENAHHRTIDRLLYRHLLYNG